MTLEGPRIAFYDTSTTTITVLSPNKVQINKTVNVSVKGTGFQNTSELHCSFTYKHNVKRRTRILRAKYVSTTLIVCFLPATKTSIIGELAILFSYNEKETSLIKKFSIYNNPPTALNAKFLRCNEGFKIVFNKNIRAVTDCANLFKRSSLELFGKKVQCKAKGRELYVLFKRQAALLPGNEVAFLARSVKGVSAVFEYPEHAVERRLKVEKSNEGTRINITVTGQRRVGLYKLCP